MTRGASRASPEQRLQGSGERGGDARSPEPGKPVLVRGGGMSKAGAEGTRDSAEPCKPAISRRSNLPELDRAARQAAAEPRDRERGGAAVVRGGALGDDDGHEMLVCRQRLLHVRGVPLVVDEVVGRATHEYVLHPRVELLRPGRRLRATWS